MLGLGFQPKWRRDEIPWMPKGRYRIMREYMPKKGRLGLDMMLRTCTIQVNLDFASEADMVKKFRVGLALQPVATALFANSPFTEGRPNGFVSYRSHIWTDTDPDRSGILPFVFEDGMGFERYVEHVLDVPMYFVYRDGQLHRRARPELPRLPEGPAAGAAGRDPDADRLERPPDDAVPRGPPQALPRDARRRRRALALACARCRRCGSGCSTTTRRSMRPGTGSRTGRSRSTSICAPRCRRHGLRTPFRDGTVQDLAAEMLALAEIGLQRRAEEDWAGQDERQFLTALRGIVETRPHPGRGAARRSTTAAGKAASTRCSASSPTERCHGRSGRLGSRRDGPSPDAPERRIMDRPQPASGACGRERSVRPERARRCR